ncbi:MAG: substrate-binding domain-containing protein [Akkermansiaceae bacterium]
MEYFRIHSGAEQVATHIKRALNQGRWKGTMPGSAKLAKDLGINAKTAEGAMRLLEQEGLLISQGRRKKRMIAEQETSRKSALRVAILEFDPASDRQTFLYQIHHKLESAGHAAFFTDKSLTDLHLNIDRVKRLVKETEADAWVVDAGSREILEWFATQECPTFALFGRRGGLPIAGIGPDQPAATREATKKLIELGHKRITLVARPSRILPRPGSTERAFLEELEKHDIETSRFNLPVWEESIDGLHRCIAELIRVTPPTAMIVSEPVFFFAVSQLLMQSGYKTPEDISLICSDDDPNLKWLYPSVAHVSWNSQPWVNRIGHWADNISHGKTDRHQSLSKANFINGGTVGPVKD